jgi:hypothetical protein
MPFSLTQWYGLGRRPSRPLALSLAGLLAELRSKSPHDASDTHLL